jgi:hypothetical protein
MGSMEMGVTVVQLLYKGLLQDKQYGFPHDSEFSA